VELHGVGAHRRSLSALSSVRKPQLDAPLSVRAEQM
jgi:hypothetical protein